MSRDDSCVRPRLGENALDWSAVEDSDAANAERERLEQGVAAPKSGGRKALQQKMRDSGKGTFSTLVDTSQPLPQVGISREPATRYLLPGPVCLGQF